MNTKELTLSLMSLIPDGKGVWNIFGDDGYSGLVWKTDEYKQPTEAECEAEWDRISYQFERNYEKLNDQLDQLWHDIDNGLLGDIAKTGSWYLSVKAVKEANPKPE